MGTIANAKVTHYYNCYNGDFIGCLQISSSDFFKFPQSYHSYICTKSLSDISTGKAYLFSALFSHEKRSNRFI